MDSVFNFSKVSKNTKAKLISDNYECIGKAMERFKFDYLLILEDDAELINESQLNKITNYLLPNLMDNQPKIVELKLYHSLRFEGFGLDRQPMVDLLLTPILIIIMCYFLVPHWIQNILMPNKLRFQPLSAMSLLGLCYILILYVLVALGRQNSVLLIRQKIVQHDIKKPAQRGEKNKTKEDFCLELRLWRWLNPGCPPG